MTETRPCPNCGSTNTRRAHQPDGEPEELQQCGDCDFAFYPRTDCGHDDPNEHPDCDYCWWNLTHDVLEDGTVVDLWADQ